MGRSISSNNDIEDSTEDFVVKAIKGAKLNVRKKEVCVLVECEGRDEDDWEPLNSIPSKYQHLLEPVQSAIDHLESIDVKSLGSRDEPHENGDDENEGEYEVEAVLGLMHNGVDIMYYLKWFCWDVKYNNWEPEFNCRCSELLEPFQESTRALKKKFKPGPGPKSKTRNGRNRPAPRSPRKRYQEGESSDDEQVTKKRPAPKSRAQRISISGKTSQSAINPTPTPKRPGPKSRTIDSFFSPTTPAASKTTSNTDPPVSNKRPGPKSRTTPAPSPVTPARESPRREVSQKEEPRTPVSDSESESKQSSEAVTFPKKRPGPLSKTSAKKPGPLSQTTSSIKKPGPKSKTLIQSKEEGDSDSSGY